MHDFPLFILLQFFFLNRRQIRASEGPEIEVYKGKNQQLVEQLEILKAQESDMTKRRDAASSERSALLAENVRTPNHWNMISLKETFFSRLSRLESMLSFLTLYHLPICFHRKS